MTTPLRIAFVINSIGSGGAERVLDLLLQHAPQSGVELHLITLDADPDMRAMSSRAIRHRLDAGGAMVASAVRLRRLLKTIEPDCVVSFLVRANMAAVLASVGRANRVVVCERMHLGSHLAGRYHGLGLVLRRLLPRILYNRASQVLAVSKGVAADLIGGFAVRAGKVLTINNPYDIAHIRAMGRAPPSFELPARFWIAAGRLVAAKGFAELIHAYRQVDPAEPLIILGEGPDRARLEALIADLDLTGRVRLAGFVANPFAVVARAALFVSASHNEGFPNALAEAMILGCPVVATDCPSGPAALLGHEDMGTEPVVTTRYGVLVRDRDPEALGEALARMANDPGALARAEAGRVRMDAFAVARVAGAYWSVFLGVADLVQDGPVL